MKIREIWPLIVTLLIGIGKANAQEVEFVGYLPTQKVEVCTIPLPVTNHIEINRMIFNTKHVYLKVEGQTFGTPFTAQGSYFGGDAYLYTEDLFFEQFHAQGEKCFPTHHSVAETEDAFARRLLCISNKLAINTKMESVDRQWLPIFDYHFLKNNCGSMANYLTECAGGKITKKINYSIGDVVAASKEAKIVELISGFEATSISSYGEICELAQLECENELE